MTREKGGDGGGSEDDSCNERLEELLGVGRFQYFIIFSFVSVISIVGAWDLLQLAFSIGDGQYRCSLPPEIEAKYAKVQPHSKSSFLELQFFLKLGDTNVSFEDSANQAFMTLKCALQIKEFV